MTTTPEVTATQEVTTGRAGRRMSTFGDRFSNRDNGFGVLRPIMASGVIVAHVWPLGYSAPEPFHFWSHSQAGLGRMLLLGFFIISGFLITGSAMKHSIGRYAWCRSLRILPGLWVCVIVTALGFAPLAAYLERGNLDGFWNHPEGPWSYLATNWLASMEQYPISGLLAHTPFGQLIGGPSAFDGSLWSLHYELAAYTAVAVLAVTATLRRRPYVVLLLALAAYVVIWRDILIAPNWFLAPPPHGAIGSYPVIGSFGGQPALYLGFVFLLGAAARLYLHRVPMHWSLALGAGIATVASLRLGGFVVIGFPAFTYLLLYAAITAPKALHRIARHRDYTYGIFLYGFPAQQLLTLVGVQHWGLVAYLMMSLATTFALAWLSWHLVEGPALRLKNVAAPSWLRRRRSARPPVLVPATVDGPDPVVALVPTTVDGSDPAPVPSPRPEPTATSDSQPG